MRPNEFRQTMIAATVALLVGLFLIAVVFLAAPSKADGILTAQEEAFGDAVGVTLCDFIDQAGVNRQSMSAAMKIIYEHTPASMDMSDAVDIINYSVEVYCPRHWNELVAFGEGARGA